MNEKILIVGLGLIGGSYAKALSKAGCYVYGLDLDDNVVEKAYSEGVIKNKKNDYTVISNAEIIVLTLYPNDISQWIKDSLSYIKDNTIITDVCGIKEKIVSEVNEIIKCRQIEFVPHHPMAGREVSGYENSQSDLFKNANFIVIDNNNQKESQNKIFEMGKLLGCNNIVLLTVKEHDEIVGYLSQLPHIIAVALMNYRDSKHYIKYTGDSFRDLTRIAKINVPLWNQLFFNNKENLIKEIELFSETLQQIKEDLVKEDIISLDKKMELSKAHRNVFDKIDD